MRRGDEKQWREAADFRLAGVVIFPELDAVAILERHKQAIGGGCPRKAMLVHLQFVHDQRVEQAYEVGAGRHLDATPNLFQRAGAADALTRLQHEHPLARAGKVRRARQAVVARADDDGIPALRRQVT